MDQLSWANGNVVGCTGVDEACGQAFEIQGRAVVVATGGITGDLARVRQHWPADWGRAPDTLLNGSHPAADGRRIGPVFVTGFDTFDMVAQIAQEGWPWTWQVLNMRIARKELAASGAEHNPHIRDRCMWAFARQMLLGNDDLVNELLTRCPDVVQGQTLEELAQRMNGINGDSLIQASTLRQQIEPYDAQIHRGPKLHNDDQLRRIEHLRRWTGERVRTCAYQPILDPDAGPLMAIRCQLLTRKSTGGIQTNLQSQVLQSNGQAIGGLYAVGEAAGFGGGGSNGRKSLEGTFLSGCLLTAQAAAAALS